VGADLKEQLREKCAHFVQYSIALDESKDISDTAQLAVFVRGVETDFTITEELLDVIPLKDTTTGEDMFGAVEDTMNDMGLPLKNLRGVATDGAPATLSEAQGFTGRMKRKVRDAGLPPISSVHCILHQEQLCAKTLHNFKSVMDVVMKCVNFCRKQGVTHRQFKVFLKDLEASYGDIPFYVLRAG
ncbi:unnamed protein product, partial [Acanthoscelides obtectus]